MFQWFYWHLLLPGRDIPGIPSQMSMAGKHPVDAPHHHGGLTCPPPPSPAPSSASIPRDSSRIPTQWTPEMAVEIATANGIDELTDRHWQVVNFMRNTYLETGTAPSIRTLGKASGVPIKELYQLFPKGPAKLAAKIGGIPKPRGCI